MKVLISVFQVGLAVMVVLFSIGALEIVSYRTINEFKWKLDTGISFPKWAGAQRDFPLYTEEHWTIRVTTP